MGCLLPYPINWILERTGWHLADAQYRAISLHGNLLLRLLHTASREERLVSITLDNLKVYVGWVTEAPNLEPHETFVEIRPALSGYRVRDTPELKLPVDYLGVEEGEEATRDIRVAIPLSSIRMVAFFDENLYSSFQASSFQAQGAADASAPPPVA